MTNEIVEIQATFLNPKKGGGSFTINNWTSYTVDSDFFLPADAFVLELDSTPEKLNDMLNQISLGDIISLSIDGKDQMRGFVETADIEYSRSGSKLILSGRDSLGLISDSNLTPDIKITPEFTYMQAIIEVLKPFGYTETNVVGTDDSIVEANRMELTSGQAVGSCVSTKNGVLKNKKLSEQIKRQLKPNKAEGRISYIQRICERAGWFIKLIPPGNEIWVGPPIYKRDNDFRFKLVNKISKPNANNILKGKIRIDWSRQPSYIIGEATGYGGKRRKSISSALHINPLTFFVSNTGVSLDERVKSFINQKQKEGYSVITPNLELLKTRVQILNNSKNYNADLRAFYIYDEEAKTLDELQISLMHKMAEFNNEFMSLDFEVNGHMNNNAVWQINMMCIVDDDSLGELSNEYWIQKRTFTKSRDGGTKTKLQLRLPYVYGFEYDPPAKPAPKSKPKQSTKKPTPPAQQPKTNPEPKTAIKETPQPATHVSERTNFYDKWRSIYGTSQ